MNNLKKGSRWIGVIDQRNVSHPVYGWASNSRDGGNRFREVPDHIPAVAGYLNQAASHCSNGPCNARMEIDESSLSFEKRRSSVLCVNMWSGGRKRVTQERVRRTYRIRGSGLPPHAPRGSTDLPPGYACLSSLRNSGLLPPAGARLAAAPQALRARPNTDGLPTGAKVGAPDVVIQSARSHADLLSFRMRQATGLARNIATALLSNRTVIKRVQIQVRPPFPFPFFPGSSRISPETKPVRHVHWGGGRTATSN